MGCGKGLALHSGYNPPHLVWPNCGWLWHHNLTTKPATFLVGLWCKCGGGYHNVPRVGPHPRHTSATHRPHSVVEVWRDRINRGSTERLKAAGTFFLGTRAALSLGARFADKSVWEGLGHRGPFLLPRTTSVHDPFGLEPSVLFATTLSTTAVSVSISPHGAGEPGGVTDLERYFTIQSCR